MTKIWSMQASAIWITAVLVVLNRVAWASDLANTDDSADNEEEQHYSLGNFPANPFEYDAVEMFGVSTFVHPAVPTLDRREAFGGRNGHHGDTRSRGSGSARREGGFRERHYQPSQGRHSFGGRLNRVSGTGSLPYRQRLESPARHGYHITVPSGDGSGNVRHKTSTRTHSSHGKSGDAHAGNGRGHNVAGAKFLALEKSPGASNSSSGNSSSTKKPPDSKSSSSSEGTVKPASSTSKTSSKSSKTTTSSTEKPKPSDICGSWYYVFFDRMEIYGKHFDASKIGEDGSKLRWDLDGKCGATTYYKFTRLENDPNGMQWHATINMAIGTKDCVGRYLQTLGGTKDGCNGAG